MRLQTFALAALLLMALLAPVGTAHTFNHEDRHEACAVYGAPQSHFIGDGHAHTHDPVVGDALHDHDPCKQVRMEYPGYENKAPLSEVLPPAVELDPLDLLFSDGDPSNTEVFIGGEAYQFPVAEGTFKVQPNLAVVGDLSAAGQGFPGSGTYDDPYIVEGYLITQTMLFKDTSKCFVIRNNVVVDRAAVGPILPDPGSIIHLPDLTPYWEDVLGQANALRAEYLDLQATWEGLRAVWDADRATWDSDKEDLDAQLADLDAQAAAWEAAWDAFEQDYLDDVARTEGLAQEFAGWSAVYMSIPEPVRAHDEFIGDDGEILDRSALINAFESYQQDLDDDLSSEDVEGWIVGNPPPEDAPPGYWDDEAAWDVERQNHAATMQDILFYIDQYWNALMADAPDDAAYQRFLADYAAFQAAHAAFMEDYEAFLADQAAFMADYDAFQDEFDQAWAETGAQIADANEHFQKVADYAFEYVGQLGTQLFNTPQELLDWLLELLFDILDIDDPNNVADNNGQFILDWNGQCVHAYNNVVNDLRLNQNNDRTGFATGGIMEENRFFTIGQIRHYDGIFRQNEVGNRAHLAGLLDPAIAIPANDRSINNDGADQGWYLDNVIYGNVDLDFHGHHHSAGFFAPLSHYHGSTYNTAYMRTGSACTATYGTPDREKASGPWVDYPTDNDIEVLGTMVVERSDSLNCLPHWDHGKRWTSVYFNDNVVIDPKGVGLRFEDRDHRADDEQANSENMRELKMPHFHQKWVQLEDNVVVGKLFVDVLNAKGTDLWSDNWAAVASPTGPGRTIEALGHSGAEIVNSHPYRNDAWLDIQGNSVFATQSSGILVSDADDLTLLQLKDNRGFGLRDRFAYGDTPASFLEWLRASQEATPDDVQSQLALWGGQDRGVQAFATLSNLRDAFRVEHCGNAARGLDRGLVALDRIYDDGASIVFACGSSSWGGSTGVELAYTPAAVAPETCTQDLRDDTAGTDDFYVTELALDGADGLPPAACELLDVPPLQPPSLQAEMAEPPRPGLP